MDNKTMIAIMQLAVAQVTSRLKEYREQVGEGTYGAVAALLGKSPEDAVIDDEELDG